MTKDKLKELYKANLEEFNEFHKERTDIGGRIEDYEPSGDNENAAWEAGYLSALKDLIK